MYYDGKCNKWVEYPRSADINDYGIFDNPRWYEDNVKGIEYVEDTPKQNFNFTI